MYENLNLRAWPFQVVPDEEFARIWAGRKQTKLQIDQLVHKMQLIPKSSLHLLWANFGMGKTHTLLHLNYICQQTKNSLVPVYTVMPNRPTGFIDLYRSIVSAFPLEHLSDQIIKVGNNSLGSLVQNPVFSRSPGIVNALLAYRNGDFERMVAARQWLIAQPGLTSRDLNSIGVTYRIKTPEDAINALTVLTRLSNYAVKSPAKLIVLIDEYQRIGELKPNTRSEINAGIHAYFNANPTGLTIVLSFSFGKKENISFLLSNELKSRSEPESILLDVLTPSQAVDFFHDLLTQFRIHIDNHRAYPFSPDALNTLIISINKRKILTPRRIMLYANHVLTNHILKFPDSTREIGTEEVSAYLSQPELGEMDVDSDM